MHTSGEETYYLGTKGFVFETYPASVKDIRELFYKLIESTIGHLQSIEKDTDFHIHETRKNYKRCRAFIRLIRSGIEEDTFKRWNALFRDQAAHFAPYRDSVIISKSLSKLCRKSENLHIARILDKYAQAAYEQHLENIKSLNLNRAPIDGIISDLIALKSEMDSTELSGEISSILLNSFKIGFNDGQKLMIRSIKSNDPETLHEWRKAQKYLLYQLKFFYPLVEKEHHYILSQLDNSQEYLGLNHDYYILEKLVLERRNEKPGLNVFIKILQVLDEEQDFTRYQAFKYSAPIYASTQKQFEKFLSSIP